MRTCDLSSRKFAILENWAGTVRTSDGGHGVALLSQDTVGAGQLPEFYRRHALPQPAPSHWEATESSRLPTAFYWFLRRKSLMAFSVVWEIGPLRRVRAS